MAQHSEADKGHGPDAADERRCLAMMADRLPLPSLIADADGHVLHVNAALARLAGLDAATALGGAWDGLLLDAADLDLADLTLEARDMQLRTQASSGIWVRATATFVSGLHLIQFQPIDDLKQALADVGNERKRWKYALESSIQGVWDHDFGHGELYYSPTWKRLRGLPADSEVDGALESWIKNVHPDDRARVLASIELQESGRAAFNIFEYRERHADGHWVWIESRGASVEWGEDGKPLRVIGTDTDITARKRDEARLEALSRRLQLALDVSQIGVFDYDMETDTVLWDQRMFEIYGVVARDANPGKGTWESLLHPDDAAAAIARNERGMAESTSFTNAFRIIRADGSLRHIRANTAPYVDADGHRRLVGANWDVTGDVRLQEELTRAKTLAEARSADLEAAKIRIEYNALHDHLTGLPNRRYLDQRLADPDARHSGVLHIDLDRFKQINDTLGHKAGDVMLVHTATLLRSFATAGDFVARIGGDEFVFLCGAERSEEDMARVSGDLVEALRQPVAYKSHMCRFGASIGIASAATSGTDAKQMLVNADIALYRAKSLGRNRYAFFSREIQAQILHSKRMADDILDGLDAGEFIPFYQPQFDARTLAISGVETLVRWRHPVKGLLTPDRFLNVAEEIGALATIDRKIVEQAHRDFRSWQARGLRIPRFSVNVSSRRLREADIAETMGSLGIEPGTLSFELLESIFLDDLEDTAIETVAALKQLGIDIEIDDFGTGHASIVSLLRLSPSRLKIDRALVNPIVIGPDQRQLVSSIIEIGHSLGIEVVAEGVETLEHAQILRGMHCDALQGYALGRPMSKADLERFAHAHRPLDLDAPLTPRGLGRIA
ncbi:sensor domain-containing protein [Ensifer soli]|uniref:sensor domain-containing protein n=1 Tax=Ciceribacter sp. sgz301302 TaxID=3342379 RepID=UPI0035B74AE4